MLDPIIHVYLPTVTLSNVLSSVGEGEGEGEGACEGYVLLLVTLPLKEPHAAGMSSEARWKSARTKPRPENVR